MKNIFKINIITYLLLLSILLCGYFNYLLIISLILIIHDLGHIVFLKLFKIKISSIIILPFGSIINSDLKLNTESYKLFIISIAGILFQLILSVIMNYLNTYGFVNNISINIFNYYNPELKEENVKDNLNNPNYKLYRIDIRDKDNLDKVFIENKIDCVIHLAAMAGVRPSIENPILYQEVNCLGTQNILECMKKNNVKKKRSY